MTRCLCLICVVLAGVLVACSGTDTRSVSLRSPQDITAPVMMPVSYTPPTLLRAEPGACTRMACSPDNPCCNTCSVESWMTDDGMPVVFSDPGLANRVGQVRVDECGEVTPETTVRGVEKDGRLVVDEVVFGDVF